MNQVYTGSAAEQQDAALYWANKKGTATWRLALIHGVSPQRIRYRIQRYKNRHKLVINHQK